MGGIEAEAVMLNQPISMVLPEVVGVKLVGVFSPISTATDLVLAITALLRKKGVVEKFVEFFGPGVASLSIADRATLSSILLQWCMTDLSNTWHPSMEPQWASSPWMTLLFSI